jgi:hypothetical protein
MRSSRSATSFTGGLFMVYLRRSFERLGVFVGGILAFWTAKNNTPSAYDFAGGNAWR